MKDIETPKGTIALLFFFVVLTIVLWSMTYLTMLSRGATQ
jgi:hypothetical protein